MGNTRWTLQGLSGRKAGNLKEVGLGGLSGVEKIEDLDGGGGERVGGSWVDPPTPILDGGGWIEDDKRWW